MVFVVVLVIMKMTACKFLSLLHFTNFMNFRKFTNSLQQQFCFLILRQINHMHQPIVGIIMGSDSDLPVMKGAVDILEDFGISYEVTVVSAHRTPHRMVDYAEKARTRGLKVIIAGAGGAAHLPGMVASITTLPVIGVPVKSSNSIDGWDSILSILQMPNGVPVATVALNASKNAGLLAAQIIATHNDEVAKKMEAYKKKLSGEVEEKIEKMKASGLNNQYDAG
jgi:5-(carboxyamino)imidazole ribonucleotide mutase